MKLVKKEYKGNIYIGLDFELVVELEDIDLYKVDLDKLLVRKNEVLGDFLNDSDFGIDIYELEGELREFLFREFGNKDEISNEEMDKRLGEDNSLSDMEKSLFNISIVKSEDGKVLDWKVLWDKDRCGKGEYWIKSEIIKNVNDIVGNVYNCEDEWVKGLEEYIKYVSKKRELVGYYDVSFYSSKRRKVWEN